MAHLHLPRTPPPPSQIRHIPDLAGPAGPLEAILNTGSTEAPFAAVLCHPYPPAGGTLHNKVVYHAAKALTALGIPTLRFNFRGVGLSAGSFDFGDGEQGDVQAAIHWLRLNLALPVLLVGFSFGAYVGLRATCDDHALVGRIALGFPVRPIAGRDYTFGFLAQCPGRLLFVSADHDQFCPIPALDETLSSLPARHQTVVIPGGDHFFAGIPGSPDSKLPLMQQAIQDWLLAEFPPV